MGHGVIVHSGRARDWYFTLIDEVLAQNDKIACRQGPSLESPHSLVGIIGDSRDLVEAIAGVDLPRRGKTKRRITFSVLYSLRRILGYHDTVLFDKYPVLAHYTPEVTGPYYPRSITYTRHVVPDDEAEMPYVSRGTMEGGEAYFIDQWKRAVHLLNSTGSRTSRRALVDFGEGYKARCVMSWLFIIRRGSLRLYQHMRSNDLVVGLPNNLVDARLAQGVMSAICGTAIGELHHQASIIQIYEEDIAGLRCVDELATLSREHEDSATVAQRLRAVPIIRDIDAVVANDLGRPIQSIDEALDRYYRIMSGLEEVFWSYNRECTDERRACVRHLIGRYNLMQSQA